MGGGTKQTRPYIAWEQPLPARSIRVYRKLIGITITQEFFAFILCGAPSLWMALPNKVKHGQPIVSDAEDEPGGQHRQR